MTMPDACSPFFDLLGAEAGAQFLHDFWAQHVFHFRANPLEWPEFLKHPAWADASELGRRYTGAVEVTKGSGAQYSAAGIGVTGAVKDLGLVARITQPQAMFPELESWLKLCEAELGVPAGSARLSAFVNPPGLGLNAHCDPTDHILIQLVGTKEVRLSPNPAGASVSVSHAMGIPARPRDALQYQTGFPQGSELPESAEQVLLAPGSVLLIPRGTYHQTRGGAEGISSTLVLNVNAPTPLERLLEFLKDYLVQDASWRRPFAYLEHSSQRKLLQEACNAIQGFPPDVVFGTTAGINATQEQLKNVSRPSDRFLRDPAVSVDVNMHGETTQILLKNSWRTPNERSLNLGAAAGQVLTYLATTRAAFDLADVSRHFPHWDAASLDQLVLLLVRHGALLRLSIPPFGAHEVVSTVNPNLTKDTSIPHASAPIKASSSARSFGA